MTSPEVRPRRARPLLARAGLAVIGGLLGLLAGELSLRARAQGVEAYYVWWPHLEKVFHVAPGTMPGIDGETHFRVNSLGLRADELLAEHEPRVLAVGGSATECLFLDQADAWPARLQAELDRRQERRRVWVGNAGKSGLNTRDHVVQLRHLLPQLGRIERVILLVGVNDLTLRLGQDEDYDARFLERAGSERELLSRSFQLLPLGREERLGLVEGTALWRSLGRLKDRWFSGSQVQDDAGRVYDTWREHRRSASRLRERLPDLTSALEEYATNLGILIDLCRDRNASVLLLTQPALWAPDLAPECEALLWFGGVGDFMAERGCEYYTVGALRSGLDAYNRTIVDVARERGVECFDLASALAGRRDAFYDDVHFNVAGSRRVAELVASFLLELPPFHEQAR
jgi:lysophospholipase L1-like esterase